MSEERKAEFRKHDLVRVSDSHRSAAVLETLAILVIGLSIGATGYLGTSASLAQITSGDTSFLERMAVSLYSLISPEQKSAVVIEDIQTGDRAHVGTTSTAKDVSTTQSSLVVAPLTDFTANTVDSIRDSFSDQVDVKADPQNSDTGIVIPKFKNKEGEAYRFLMVPVKTESATTSALKTGA